MVFASVRDASRLRLTLLEQWLAPERRCGAVAREELFSYPLLPSLPSPRRVSFVRAVGCLDRPVYRSLSEFRACSRSTRLPVITLSPNSGNTLSWVQARPDPCAVEPGAMATAMVTDDPDQLLLNPPDPNLICPVCLKLFSQPVRTACG